MARNFRGLKISRFSRISHEPRKFYPRKFNPYYFFSHTYCAYAVRGATCQHDLQSFYTVLSCCLAMALDRYFQAWGKSSCKLPDPRGPLSRLVPSSSIESANEGVQSWKAKNTLGVGERDNATPSELKAEIGRRAAEHGVAATCSQVLRYDCETSWAMGVVNLQLEVGGASTAWRSSKIKLRKV